MEIRIGRRREGPRDFHKELIDETSRFLSWALSEDRDLPRIPTAKVGSGGFDELMKMPGARKIAAKWWIAAIDRIES